MTGLMILFAVLSTCGAIAVSQLLNGKAGSQALAAGAPRTLTAAIHAGHHGFQSSPGTVSELEAGHHFDNVTGTGTRSGAMFSGAQSLSSWTWTASPVIEGTTGERFSFVAHNDVVRDGSTKTANATSGAAD